MVTMQDVTLVAEALVVAGGLSEVGKKWDVERGLIDSSIFPMLNK